jgi:hypothetical protein
MLEMIPLEIKYLMIGVLGTVIAFIGWSTLTRWRDLRARQAVIEEAIHNNARSTAEVFAPKIGAEHEQAIYRAVRQALCLHELWICREQKRHLGRKE